MSLRDVVQRFKQVRALVIGDAIVDVYHWGRCDRISQEAPVPVFVEELVERRGGGALNVGKQLREMLGEQAIWDIHTPTNTSTAKPDASELTEKHRYMVGHQQIFRADYDKQAPPDWITPQAIERYVAFADVLILSDYAKGALTDDVCKTAIECAKAKGIPIVVDPKGSNWRKYEGATVICPNETECISGYMWPGLILAHKRGPKGIDIHNPSPINYPACARQVFDVTGAGDVVVALIAATLAAKGTIAEAAQLANIAAGYAVGQVGTAVCPLEQLMAAIL